jgi:hypothetical protein
MTISLCEFEPTVVRGRVIAGVSSCCQPVSLYGKSNVLLQQVVSGTRSYGGEKTKAVRLFEKTIVSIKSSNNEIMLSLPRGVHRSGP